MWKILKQYWDIFGGAVIGMTMTLLAKFQLYKVQLCYSVIILVLVSIGVLRIIKQAVDKNKGKKSHHNVIDSMVDTQKPVKAISIAQNPTKDGEVLGRLILKLWEGLKKIMKKFKELFDKFKGIVLAIALGILTAIEMYGGFINELFDGKLCIKGVEVLPLVTLVASIVVGIISNGWTKEQKEKIKALFSKSCSNEIVQAEIKKTLKEDEAKVKEFNKLLAKKQTELENLTSDLEAKNHTLSAKREMSVMTPRLATDEDVLLASEAVADVETEIVIKKKEIAEVETSIKNLNIAIDALKSKL